MFAIGKFLFKAIMPPTARAKEDIVSAAHAFAVALEGDHASATSRLPPSASAQGPATANLQEEGAHHPKEFVTTLRVSQHSDFIAEGAPSLWRGKWARSFATAIIALIFLTGGALLMVKDAPLEFARGFYVRAMGELHRLTASEHAEGEETARKATEKEELAKEIERKATEEQLAYEAATRRQKEDIPLAANQQRTPEALPREAEAQAAPQATAKRQDPEVSRAEQAERHATTQKPKSVEDTRQQAQRAEADLNLSEQDRKKVQVSLSALGHQIPSDGYFGPITRAMITAWQTRQGLPATGFLNVSQVLALHEQATQTQRSVQTKSTVQHAEKAEAGLNLSEQDRKRMQVALTSLGHAIPTATGVFGPRTRAMIAAWQKTQGLPDTGYLTEAQIATLQQQAAPALSFG